MMALGGPTQRDRTRTVSAECKAGQPACAETNGEQATEAALAYTAVAKEFGMPHSSVYLGCHSAGGRLSLLLSMRWVTYAPMGAAPPAGFAGIEGIYNASRWYACDKVQLKDQFKCPTLQTFAEPPPQGAAVWASGSPMSLASADAPAGPVLLIHSPGDTWVSTAQATELYAKLKASSTGGKHRLDTSGACVHGQHPAVLQGASAIKLASCISQLITAPKLKSDDKDAWRSQTAYQGQGQRRLRTNMSGCEVDWKPAKMGSGKAPWACVDRQDSACALVKQRGLCSPYEEILGPQTGSYPRNSCAKACGFCGVNTPKAKTPWAMNAFAPSPAASLAAVKSGVAGWLGSCNPKTLQFDKDVVIDKSVYKPIFGGVYQCNWDSDPVKKIAYPHTTYGNIRSLRECLLACNNDGNVASSGMPCLSVTVSQHRAGWSCYGVAGVPKVPYKGVASKIVQGGLPGLRMGAGCFTLDAARTTSADPFVPTVRVLTMGNSFTYVNDLPHQLANIAKSKGIRVYTASSLIGGCTLYGQCPALSDKTTALLADPAGWDYIVVHSYSILPAIKAAREKYLKPAIRSLISKKRKARLMLYMTWGYESGNPGACPGGHQLEYKKPYARKGCFPLGSLASMTSPNCSTNSSFKDMTGSFPCMAYANARGYLSAGTVSGVDLVAPCGAAWMTVRGVQTIPAKCQALTDAQYGQPLRNVKLPILVQGGTDRTLNLYRRTSCMVKGVMQACCDHLGAARKCDKRGARFDKHPNILGQYLNAAVLFGTMFGISPVGAAMPLPTDGAGAFELHSKTLKVYGGYWAPTGPYTAAQVRTLQVAAAGVVFGSGTTVRKAWAAKYSEPFAKQCTAGAPARKAPAASTAKVAKLAQYVLRSRTKSFGLKADLSGTAWNPQRRSFVAVRNTFGDARIEEVSASGKVLRGMRLTGFDDTEAVTWMSGDTYGISEEKNFRVCVIQIPPGAGSQALDVKSCLWVEPKGAFANAYDLNKGMEGLSWDASRQVFYGFREKAPMAILQFGLDGKVCTLLDLDQRFNPRGQRVNPLSAAALATTPLSQTAFSDIAGAVYEPQSDRIYLLSQESALIVAITRQGVCVDRKAVVGMTQPEGITLALQNRGLLVVGEPDEANFYSLAPSLTMADLAPPAALASAGAGGGSGAKLEAMRSVEILGMAVVAAVGVGLALRRRQARGKFGAVGSADMQHEML